MIHVIRQIERRLGRHPGEGRIAARAALLSALLLGVGALLSSRADAQESPQENVQDFDPAREAKTMLDTLDAGDFAAVHARFDATMAAAISAEQLAQGLKALATQVGPLQSRGEADVKTRDIGALVTIPLHYERGELTAIFTFDNERKISGFAIRPAQAAKPATAAPAVPEDANYRETEATVGEGESALPATLAMPNGEGKGKLPAVVLVHGSGPQDRDSTIGPNRPLLDIARGLAERGIAVLRYEKRTRARPQQFANGGSIDLETTDDAVTAAALLRGLPEIDPKRVFALGHSQGAMMAPRIGARDPQIAGLILLAAPSRPLLDILIEQNRRLAILNDGKVSDSENTAIQQLVDSVSAVRKGREMTAAQSPMGLPPAYWRSVDAVDAVAEAKTIVQPMLILQGARDIQVVDADWQGWKRAFHDSPRVTFKLYETLNHLGIPGEGDGNLQEYQTPGHVSPELIADVAAWIAAQKPE